MTLELEGVPRYFTKKYRGTLVHGTAHLCSTVKKH